MKTRTGQVLISSPETISKE
uniref:Uncharacterized protein n=1 Tax=Arundo donax TaxID=35708 RepID=A0A0A9CA96_ARUDO